MARSVGFLSLGLAAFVLTPGCGRSQLYPGTLSGGGAGGGTDAGVAGSPSGTGGVAGSLVATGGAAAGRAPVPSCGDGVVEPSTERCDDGNLERGDGCSPECHYELTDLALGKRASCARGAERRLKCWGWNEEGELGLGDHLTRGRRAEQLGTALPFVDLGTDRRVVDYSLGEYHACAVLDFGHLKCWGDGSEGALGLGDTFVRGISSGSIGDALPFVDLGDFLARKVKAGSNSTCAIDEFGRVKCWGLNGGGSLGLGDRVSHGDQPGEMGDALPFVDLGSGVSALEIALGSGHTCALLTSGKIKCWGANWLGQLGLPGEDSRGDDPGEMGDALPVVDLGTGYAAIAVVAHDKRACAVLSNGQLKCWGDNSQGYLGLGDFARHEMGNDLPPVDLGTGAVVTEVALGDQHTCALLHDGSVKCWGSNAAGQLGDASVDTAGELRPMGDELPALDLGGGHVTGIVASGSRTCAKLAPADVPDAPVSVKCWGGNEHGELGLGDVENRGDEDGEMGENLPWLDVGF